MKRTTISNETRFTAEGHELNLGAECFSRKLFWSAVRGTGIQKTYGVYSGFEGASMRLKLRHANRDYRCSDCGEAIDKGDMHGSTYYDHFCLNCVDTLRKTDFREEELNVGLAVHPEIRGVGPSVRMADVIIEERTGNKQ